MESQLKSFPSDAAKLITIKSPNGEKTRCYPLHMACMRQPPVSTIAALLAACVEANGKIDSMHGRLPIHFACLFGAPFEVILLLGSTNAYGIKSRAKDGSLPLHLACKQREPHFDAIHYLIRTFPKGLKVKNEEGNVPLDMVSCNKTMMAVRSMVSNDSKSLVKKPSSISKPMEFSCCRNLVRRTTQSSPKLSIHTNSLYRNEVRKHQHANVKEIRLTFSNVSFSVNGSIRTYEEKKAAFKEGTKKKILNSNSKKCVVCMERDVNHVILPCGHICLCQICSRPKELSLMKWNCPECRGKINNIYRVYGRVVDDV